MTLTKKAIGLSIGFFFKPVAAMHTPEGHRKNIHLRLISRNPPLWFSTRSDTNQPVQVRKLSRRLEVRISKELYNEKQRC